MCQYMSLWKTFLLTSPQWFLSTVFDYAHVKWKTTIFNNQFIKGSIEKTNTQIYNKWNTMADPAAFVHLLCPVIKSKNHDTSLLLVLWPCKETVSERAREPSYQLLSSHIHSQDQALGLNTYKSHWLKGLDSHNTCLARNNNSKKADTWDSVCVCVCEYILNLSINKEFVSFLYCKSSVECSFWRRLFITWCHPEAQIVPVWTHQ